MDGISAELDSLVGAAAGVRRIVAMVQDRTVEGLDDEAQVGHSALASTLADFCARWQQGIGALVYDQEQVAVRLEKSAKTYLGSDVRAAERMRSAALGLDTDP